MDKVTLLSEEYDFLFKTFTLRDQILFMRRFGRLDKAHTNQLCRECRRFFAEHEKVECPPIQKHRNDKRNSSYSGL